MFKLQLQWQKQGLWEDSVYPPKDYATALNLLNTYTKAWGNEHSYRIISTGASK